MKKLIVGALLVALSGASSMARAESTRVPPAVVAEAPAARMSQTTAPVPAAEASDYAAREAATPALGQFQGGEATIFIGGSALAVLLIVLLIVLIV